MQCRGDGFPRRFSFILSARIHHQFIIATGDFDWDAYADFFHHRFSSSVLGPYN
jgi:hypothetical protein